MYLGANNAGDSSAVNQYAYALNKMGNRSRGDITTQGSSIMNDINDREIKIKNVFTQEKTRIDNEKASQLSQVANTFLQAQQQLQQARANGELNKSQDLASLSQTLLNNALNQINTINQNVQSKASQLETWALNNSKTVAEAKSKLGQFGNYQAQLPTYQAGNYTPTSGGYGAGGAPAVGYGVSQQKKDIYGNIIQ